MKRIGTLLIALIVTAGIIQACSSEAELSAVDSSNPFESISPAASEFTFSNTEDKTFHLESGTNIIIPADVFMTPAGEKVTDVTLKYEEYHDATDIILSGITMKYDSAGENYDFKSAGMFDIRAYSQSGEELVLQVGKEVRVEMGSYREGEEYSFYQLDDESNSWAYQGKASPVPNSTKATRLAELESQEPARPIKPQNPSGSQVFNLDVDYTRHPELEAFDRVLWEFNGGKRVPDSVSKALSTTNWASTEIQRDGGTYKLVFESGVKKVEVPVIPILTGRDYETASANYASGLAAFESQMEAYGSKLEAINKEAELLRCFNVTNLGACNWDTFMKMVADGTRRQLAADFKFDSGVDRSAVRLMLITNNGGSVMQYNHNTWNNFIFDPTTDNKIIAVLPGDEMAVYKKGDLNKMYHGSDQTFRMESVGKVASRDELREIIESI